MTGGRRLVCAPASARLEYEGRDLFAATPTWLIDLVPKSVERSQVRLHNSKPLIGVSQLR